MPDRAPEPVREAEQYAGVPDAFQRLWTPHRWAYIGGENKPSDDSYYLLYKAKVPSVMVECGFMSNVKENNQLKQDVYRRRVAFCILAGLSDTMKTGELP